MNEQSSIFDIIPYQPDMLSEKANEAPSSVAVMPEEKNLGGLALQKNDVTELTDKDRERMLKSVRRSIGKPGPGQLQSIFDEIPVKRNSLGETPEQEAHRICEEQGLLQNIRKNLSRDESVADAELDSNPETLDPLSDGGLEEWDGVVLKKIKELSSGQGTSESDREKDQ